MLSAFSIGANDAANGMAMSYGTRVLSVTSIYILSCTAEFIGGDISNAQRARYLPSKIVANFVMDVKQRKIANDSGVPVPKFLNKTQVKTR